MSSTIYKQKCKICKKHYQGFGALFCSQVCHYKNMEGQPSGSSGKHWKLSEKAKANIGLAKEESKNPLWKGDDVGYAGLHMWIQNKLGKPNKCEFCKKENGKFEWANKSKKYFRNLQDWLRLCISCHRKYDYRGNLQRV